MKKFIGVVSAFAMTCAITSMMAGAATVDVRVSVENLAPTNSISFAPFRLAFNNGTYDSFDEGATASPAIISIAEGGTGSAWYPAFAAADPTSTPGVVVPNPAGPLLPGATGFADFTVDTSINQYFTFASMVVPSNDYFIGNDDPMGNHLFDASGNLLINSITLTASDIWDAGSEVDDPANAAFVVGGNNDDRIPDDDVVMHQYADLGIFNGLTTAAGYVFDLQLESDTPVYRVTFEVVPEPTTALLMSLGLLALRRR